jgi:hypothetical protein
MTPGMLPVHFFGHVMKPGELGCYGMYEGYCP